MAGAVVNARCNWTRTAGNDLSQLVPTRLYEEDVFVKPKLDDVIGEDRAVLFSNNDSSPAPCELSFSISPRFKISVLTLVCSVPKVELFLGPSQEYYETIYGTTIEDDDGDVPIRPYRYDVEIDRSGICDINLKLLTSSNEICIYGTVLYIAPNPNGITTQLPRPMDLQKIQEILLKGGSSPGGSDKSEEQSHKFQQFMALLKGCTTSQTHTLAEDQKQDLPLDISSLKVHIDTKLQELEQRLTSRMEEFQIQQANKLDKILAMLEKN